MHYFKYADKDATLYELSASLNSGIDEILTITKNIDPIANSRIVLYFNLSSISASKASGLIASESYFLNLFTSNAEALPLSYTLLAYPLSSSFEMGTGTSTSNLAITNGVSWKYTDGINSWITSSFAANTTGSWNKTAGGGVWYTTFSASQDFEYESSDIRMNVTNIILNQLSGSLPNFGLIIKRTDFDESSNSDLGTLNMFSTDTHTIYIPRLEVVWDDSKIASGSISVGNTIEITSSAVVSIKNLNPIYRTETKSSFRVSARPMWITKTFVTQSQFEVPYMLPTASYYSIRDAKTDEVIVPFDYGTKLSRDNQGSYFNLWLNGFQPERFYRILISTTISNFDQLFDNVATFKVVR